MTQAGWYDDGSGRQRWWDGSQWTDQFQDGGQEVADDPVLTFESEISGDRSTVEVFRDRIEWAKRSGGISAGKITAGIFTAGMSLAATGVGKGSYTGKKSTDLSVIHLSTVTGISSVKDGKRVLVTVSTPSMALPLDLPKKEAEQVARTLNNLVTAARAPQQAQAVTVQVAAPAAAQSTAPVDATAQLQRLAELHQQGILSDDEFAAAKAKALGL